MVGDALWEENAAWWQQSFTQGADPEYEEQVLPMVAQYLGGARRVLDVGCGEGQVSRHIAQLGAEVVGVDPAAAQVGVARDRGGPPCYVRASAQQLPYLDRTFDAAVVCMALEHVDPFEPAIREIARILAPGGRLLLFLVHPLLQAPGSGWVDDVAGGEQYWRVGQYLRDDVQVDEVAPGVRFQFAHRPLSRYVHEMGTAHLLIDDMVEPSPPPQVLLETGGFPNAGDIPRLLLLLARRVDEIGHAPNRSGPR